MIETAHCCSYLIKSAEDALGNCRFFFFLFWQMVSLCFRPRSEFQTHQRFEGRSPPPKKSTIGWLSSLQGREIIVLYHGSQVSDLLSSANNSRAWRLSVMSLIAGVDPPCYFKKLERARLNGMGYKRGSIQRVDRWIHERIGRILSRIWFSTLPSVNGFGFKPSIRTFCWCSARHIKSNGEGHSPEIYQPKMGFFFFFFQIMRNRYFNV